MNPRRVDYKDALIVALTGASGVKLGLWFLKYIDIIREHYSYVYVVYTKNAERVARLEEDIDLREYLSTLDINGLYSSEEIDAPLSSTSRLVKSDMVIIPASLNTIAKVANGIQDNLVTRTACNILRLRRKLIVVVRETPLSIIDIRNLYILARANTHVLPATIALYPKPTKIEDVYDFIIGKVLDVLEIPHSLYQRWSYEIRK